MAAAPSAPLVEHHPEPLGIGERTPRLSWRIHADPSWRQVAYELELTYDGNVFTHRVESAHQILVPWPGEPLKSRQRVVARVRVEGEDGTVSSWSDPTTLEAGLLDASDWLAAPVGGAWLEDPESDDRRPALVRREFELEGDVASARLYVSAHGLYEVEINGRRVGDGAMSPGWTTYRKRLRYYTYDVTDYLHCGRNAVGSWLGDGWYRGRLGWRGGFRNLFGSDLSLLAQLEVQLTDGRNLTVATDASWLAAPSPIMRAGNYDGEFYDAREEQPGWSCAGFDDSSWSAVDVRYRDPATLVAPTGPPVRCTQEVAPVSLQISPTGKQILDFGQNLVGRTRIRVRGPRGTTLVLRTAEVLQAGELHTRTLRGAASTDTYILAGSDVEEWEPRFTFHGFRYLEVSGWPGNLQAAVEARDIVARVYHTDMTRTGWFECSDDLLNRLHENIVWSMRGNFLDIPTDCPQRDERVGWTGDIQIFARTAAFLYDCCGMLSSWLADVALEQLPDGTVPWYVPVIPAHQMWTPIRPGAAWGDAAVLVPWALYERFGDAKILETQYASAKKWVDLVERLAGPDRLWNEGFQLGDWLDPDAPPGDPADAKTDKYLVATAYFAWSADHVARMADVLGRDDEARKYRTLADEVRAAFAREYVSDDRRLSSDAPTAYALAVSFDLLPDRASRCAAGDRLAALVESAKFHISTGFVGTAIVSEALTTTGHLDVAYRLLMQRECPSWLYPVTQGATTIWERWDSLLPDGTVNPGQMTSFNHYALGCVGDWMQRVVAGLAPAAPGYRKILFKPRPGGGLTSAAARHESPYGTVSITWRLADGVLYVDVEVPTGTTAVLDIEGCPVQELGPGSHSAALPHCTAVGRTAAGD